MSSRSRAAGRRARLAALPVLAVAVLACDAAGGADAPTTARPVTTSGATSTTTTTTTTPTTTTTARPTTTGSTTTSTSTSTTTTSSTSTSTTTTAPPPPPPPVGGFECRRHSRSTSVWAVRPPSDLAPPALSAGWTVTSAGRSVQGRDIEVLVRAVDAPRRRVVVIGGVHGNEPVTPPAVRGLLGAAIAPDVEVWLVPVANPDGSAAGMRCNAAGVDLNRNFSWAWRPDDGGPAALSEPESQALAALVEQLRPDLVIWVHQPLGYVSSIGPTSAALEDAWAGAAGLPVRPDVTQHGGGESWTALVAGVPAMLIEIDGWDATPGLVDAARAGFEATVAALG